MFTAKNQFKKVVDVAAETDKIRERILKGEPVSDEELKKVLDKRRELGMPNLDKPIIDRVGDVEGQPGPVR